jgi:hypothetical protein
MGTFIHTTLNRNSVLSYITQNPQEIKRLIGIDYEQLQQLITQAAA